MKKLFYILMLVFVAIISFSQQREHDNGPAFIAKILLK